jgi:DNA polymerase
MIYDANHDQVIRDIIYYDWSERRPMTDEQNQLLKTLRPLKATCKECRMCRLGRMDHEHNGKPISDHHVFSNMNPTKFMVVGQNPGFNECMKDEPFVGEAGEFFNQALAKFGVQREVFYITNAVKCHTPENRKPEGDEFDACQAFLQIEIKTIRPKFVIALGAVAFEALCPKLTFSANLGKFLKSEKFDVNVYPIYHPSPQNMADPGRKTRFEADIKAICELIIRISSSEVQRSAPQAS